VCLTDLEVGVPMIANFELLDIRISKLLLFFSILHLSLLLNFSDFLK